MILRTFRSRSRSRRGRRARARDKFTAPLHRRSMLRKMRPSDDSFNHTHLLSTARQYEGPWYNRCTQQSKQKRKIASSSSRCTHADHRATVGGSTRIKHLSVTREWGGAAWAENGKRTRLWLGFLRERGRECNAKPRTCKASSMLSACSGSRGSDRRSGPRSTLIRPRVASGRGSRCERTAQRGRYYSNRRPTSGNRTRGTTRPCRGEAHP